jgi:lysine-ketoglutarate reductase/saccharopine dehydrogenase-like protein (TIGR00300 family)
MTHHTEVRIMALLPDYTPPDFNRPDLAAAPPVCVAPAPADGVMPEGFHATSNHPEYLHLGGGAWILARESRMDAVFVLRGESVYVLEPRLVKRGENVVLGRSENGEEGVYVHTIGFSPSGDAGVGKFSFRTLGTRETPFSRSYDELYQLLRHEKEHGHLLWVLGPAVAFDRDSRSAMQGLIEHGFCHALLAGNALATHDLEAAMFGTGLGQDIYTQELRPQGHYNHLDVINEVCKHGSIKSAISQLGIKDGIIAACEKRGIPYVLAGSIRDDGPLPEVITDTCKAQDAMRNQTSQATTVIALATQLHSIAVGNMLPSYKVMPDDTVRPVLFYVVDMAEFSVDKLANRGSAQAVAILTNAQDFVVNLWHNLQEH